MKNGGAASSKFFLYITSFFSGMSVMAVELGASRLMAPYFSSSQIVWTVIIGTIMIAMAVGNIWGGKMADKNPSPDRLYCRLLIAAVWIAAIPMLGRYVLLGVSLLLASFISHNFLIWASLVSCLIIFVFPLILLGTVTPSLVKFITENLENNARIVGSLDALNTIGSIIGTFLPTFVTIPAVGTGATFIIFSAILALVSIVYFISTRRRLRTCAVLAAVIAALGVFGTNTSFAFWEKDIVYEDESIYNYLKVNETEDEVILSTNVLFGVQSIKMKNGGLTGMYYDYALAAPVMAGLSEHDGRVLILGLGSGTFASACLEYFPDVYVDGVEIDRKISDTASEYFDMPSEVSVTVEDGRAYLQTYAREEKYDVIMVDAYQDITIPFQMSSAEFFKEVSEHLNEDGVMVVNMNMRSGNEGSINAYLCDTISSVFPEVWYADVGGNREVYASFNRELMDRFGTERLKVEDPELTGLLGRMEFHRWQAGDLILTDDKAPVELLGMKVLDEIVSSEIEYYREIYFSELGDKGLAGLAGELLGG